MNIPLDWLLVILLTSICIVYSVRSMKDGARKTDAIITITTAFLTLVIYFFDDFNNGRQQKELITINDRQLKKMEIELEGKISVLQTRNNNINEQLKACQDSHNQTVTGRDNNVVNGTGNTVVSIKGNDGSVINYNTLDRPFFERTIDVSRYINTGIAVNRGEQVFITATGSIQVGPSVGSSGPDGRESGVFGLSLEPYNIIRSFKHAALMFKLSAQDDWIQCGSSYKFKAYKSGFLIFQVNDNDQSNNAGSYSVTVQKFKSAN